MFSPSMSSSPSTEKSAILSFMRFKVLNRVDLPQPDGPISAVIDLLGTAIVTDLTASKSP